MSTDAELLRRYAEEKSEAAFTELVRRHVDLVYGAAWRRLGGDAQGAADVVQRVFTALARQAPALARHSVLPAWLYAATRNVSIDNLRAERRRRAREQEAFLMNEQTATAPSDPTEWERLRPALDEVMDELVPRDREAVLLRFFARQPFAEIGRALNLSEDAARMRVERALEKLRILLARRGVTSTSAALGVMLGDHAAMAAPAGLAANVAGAAVLSGAGAGALAGFIHFMSTSKLLVGIAGLASFAVWGGAVREIRARDRVAEAVVAANLANDELARRLRALQRPNEPAVRENAPAAAQGYGVAQSSAQSEADMYLARHPELRAALERQVRASAASRWVSFIRQRRLTPEQAGRFLDLVVHNHSYTFSGPNDTKYQFQLSGDRGAARRELRALLGEGGFNDFVEFYGAGLEITRIPAQLASMLYFTPTPLTTEQADWLTASLRDRQVRPDATSPKELDWDAIVKDAAEILTEPQMTALMHLRFREEADGMLWTIR